MSDMPKDPMTYIGRVTRDENGKAKNIEIFYPEEVIEISQADEFITFTTVVVLETLEPYNPDA